MSVRLDEWTTFRLGGPCRRLVHCRSELELRQAVRELADGAEPFLLLGGGSNLLVSDHGIDRVVLRFCSHAGDIRITPEGAVTACGAMPLDLLAARLAEAGREGLMCCTGIPGTVGGAVVGNAGAWGRQVSDTLLSVTLMDRKGATRSVEATALGFAYRDSFLKRREDIVVSATFHTTPGDPAAMREERERILALRAQKHPDLVREPCIGSIFRNIEPSSAAGRRQAAGWFLDRAGAKAMREGGARVFERHANIIVKGDGCTAQQVRDLAARMAAAVETRFGLSLVREVRYLGQFDREPAREGFF